jgi:hypothetical protein
MQKVIKTILLSGLLAGTLDCISAVVFLGKMNFSGVWKYVASGYFGSDAFAGSNEMVVFGLLFHFTIALFWAVAYYFIITRISFFTSNIVLGGLLYGIVIWCVMSLVVLPFTSIPKSSFTTIGVIKNMVILMLCVGLPISLVINRRNKM